MRTKIIFDDSIDDSGIDLSTDTDNNHYILAITSDKVKDVWFTPEDFLEFLNECQRFYTDNEKRKTEQSTCITKKS